MKKVLAPELGLQTPNISQNPVADAIVDAVDEGCRVINMSLGFGAIVRTRTFLLPQFGALYDACMYALRKGVVVVVAAGNAGSQRFVRYSNTITPPAAFGGSDHSSFAR